MVGVLRLRFINFYDFRKTVFIVVQKAFVLDRSATKMISETPLKPIELFSSSNPHLFMNIIVEILRSAAGGE